MKHIHLIGIGGSGMSAIARFLLEKGYKVSGSDRTDSWFLNDLKILNAIITIGHHPSNIAGADLIIRSSAIPDNNPEIEAAIEKGIPVMKRADFLGKIMDGKDSVGVAGTHGKTTTSAMLAWVLTELGQDPSFILGGVIKNINMNAHAGNGGIFVIEADEYDRMFLGLKPIIEVITNVEHDHPDCYPTQEDFYKAFQDFVDLLDKGGHLVLCGKDIYVEMFSEITKHKDIPVHLYGIVNEGLPIDQLFSYARNLTMNGKGGYSFNGSIKDIPFQVNLQVPGKHNVLNSLAVLTVIHILGLPIEEAAIAIGSFLGTDRRFEVLGEVNGITIIDDYAHHPTEIQATLEAARSRYADRKLWAVWQPHTYSRTRLMLSEFSKSFMNADHVIVMEVYAAREQKQDFSAEEVVNVMKRTDSKFIASIDGVVDYLIKELSPKDVLLVLSAGDADQISKKIFDHFKNTR